MQCIYGVLEGYIQLYSPETEDLVRPRPRAEDEPNPRSRRYIAVYRPTRPHIYNIYPFLRAIPQHKNSQQMNFFQNYGTILSKTYCVVTIQKREVYGQIWFSGSRSSID